MIPLLLLILVILTWSLYTHVEPFSDSDTNIMVERVKKYPTSFSVDPFFNSTFKPECCPNIYSSSSGCLCIDRDIFSLVYSRGGNSYNFNYAS
jgi:hypothetical protein